MGIHVTPIFNINFSHLEVGNLEVQEDASITGDLDANTATFNSLSVTNGGDITVDDIYIQNMVHGGNADFNQITGKIKTAGTATQTDLVLGTYSYDITPNDATTHSAVKNIGNSVILEDVYYNLTNKTLAVNSKLPTIISPPTTDEITTTYSGTISFTLTCQYSVDAMGFTVYNTYTGTDVLLATYKKFTSTTQTLAIADIRQLKLKFVFNNTWLNNVSCSVKLNTGTGNTATLYV